MTRTSEPIGHFGSTTGSFAVNADGGASYSILIAAPPGIAKLDPNLSFASGSSGGNIDQVLRSFRRT